MATIEQIQSADWSLSISEAGAIVEGVDDINQCILIIILTEKGSDPLRPEFGCGILQYIDLPSSIAIPNIISEIVNAIEIWEKRARVTKVVHEQTDGQVQFTVYWRDARSQNQSEVTFFLTEKNTLGYTTTPSNAVVQTTRPEIQEPNESTE